MIPEGQVTGRREIVDPAAPLPRRPGTVVVASRGREPAERMSCEPDTKPRPTGRAAVLDTTGAE